MAPDSETDTPAKVRGRLGIPKETWDQLADLVGECKAECEHGGCCSLPAGHESDHEAWGIGRMLCSWPNTGEV